MMKDRALTVVIQVNWEETELQLVSRQPGGFKRQGERGKKKGKLAQRGVMERKGYFKNCGLFLELSKGIKDLMNCLLEARSLSDIVNGAKGGAAVTRVLM